MPSLKQRTGDFSELCPEGFSHGFCNNPENQLFNVFANAPYLNNQVPQGPVRPDFKKSAELLPASERRHQSVLHHPNFNQ